VNNTPIVAHKVFLTLESEKTLSAYTKIPLKAVISKKDQRDNQVGLLVIYEQL